MGYNFRLLWELCGLPVPVELELVPAPRCNGVKIADRNCQKLFHHKQLRYVPCVLRDLRGVAPTEPDDGPSTHTKPSRASVTTPQNWGLDLPSEVCYSSCGGERSRLTMNWNRDRRAAIPRPALERMPVYYRRLMRAIEEEMLFVSSDELGRSVGVPGAQVRKDLSCFSEHGRPGVGYDVLSLVSFMEEFLGLVNDKEAVLVGVGNLGRALALYPGFAHYRLRIVALFDNDVAKVGQTVGVCRILPVAKLTNLSQRLRIQMGIITVPSGAAQEVAEAMVAGGIKVIWNFAPCRLVVPDGVLVRNEDLAAQLAVLSHYITQRRVTASDGAGKGDGTHREENLC